MNETHMMVLELASKGYSCAQIVVHGGLDLMGRENPDLIRAMSGLAQGVGCSGEICGALSGGVCLLAMHTGKGMDGEDALPENQPLMNALVEWFREELCHGGAITCDAILSAAEGTPDANGMNAQVCGTLVAETWIKALALLMEAGIDLSMGRDMP